MAAFMTRRFTLSSLASAFAALGMAALQAKGQARRPKSQPNMESALQHLDEARRSLSSASSDKGGHRLKAIEFVDKAIAEVRAGIQYANTH